MVFNYILDAEVKCWKYGNIQSKIIENILSLDVYHKICFNLDQSWGLSDLTLDKIESRLYVFNWFYSIFSLLVGSEDGSIHLFDTCNRLDTGDSIIIGKLASFKNDSILSNFRRSYVNCIQWYPVDNGMFISASADKTVKIWSSTCLKVIETIKCTNNISWLSVSNVACNHNLIGASLTSFNEGCSRAILIDCLMGLVAINLCGGHSSAGLTQIMWSRRSSNLVITGGRDGRILYWDVRFPIKPVYSLDKNVGVNNSLYTDEALAHRGPVLGLTSSPDGLHLISWGGADIGVNSNCLRLWSSELVDFDQRSYKNTQMLSSPLMRDINFDTSIQGLEQNSNSTLLDISRPVRLAEAPGTAGELWGGSAAYVFVPSKNRLLITLASKNTVSTRTVTRHFSKIHACAWNNRQYELYTCGTDGNLFSWPICNPDDITE